ncbi:S-layer homology domain-containing protein [Tumebacillus sp. ITR2]|uniref:S-layer homology domain-containing protein n=1 Tax=Tumebacillus amylolyticus TaxID=2801339 RepID=A0ABS1J5C2_9BACL|nr:S-layer homology domain-containing protein [Tumebacillus amylolyticus]
MTKSKKLTATVAASAVASALVAPAAFAGTNFSDIDGSFAKDAIIQLADAGILNGVGGGQFNPTGLIERQDFAIVLAKALKLDTSAAPATATFSDIPADHYAYAAVEACVKAGLIKGQGNGTFGEGANLTREDMAVFFGRALNLVAGSDVVTGQASKLNFSDAASISDYAKDAVGAAFDLGYISGSNGAFDPKGTATREQVASLATRWMTAADKVANNVFAGVTYTDANTLTINFSKEVADIKAADVTVASKADGKAVAVSAVTLSADKKSATVKTDALAGATTYSVTFGGKTVEVTTPDKLDATVAAAGAKKISVTFNSAVDTTKASFSVKKGSIAINVASVAFDDAKKVATLTLSSNLTAGDYTVAANGLANAVSKTFTAEDQKVAKVDINDNAILTGVPADASKVVNVAYTVSNQYGEDVTTTLGTGVKFTVGNGTGADTDSDGAYTVTSLTDAGYKVGDKITIAVLDPTTGTFVSKAVTVSDKSSVSEVTISDLFNTNAKTLSAATNLATDEFDLVVSAKDQYGNAVAAGKIANDVLVTVSDSSIVTIGAFKDITLADGTKAVGLQLMNGNGALTARAGAAKVTIVSRTTGKLASYDVNVKETVAVDTLSMTAPDLAVAGETVTIPYTAVDQFGAETTDVNVLQNGVTFTSTVGTVAFVPNYVTGKAELKLTLPADANAGHAVISAITSKAKSAFVNVAYQKTAVPTVITGLKNINTNFAKDGASKLTLDNVVLADQYGRTYDNSKLAAQLGAAEGNYQLKIESSDSAKVDGATTFTSGIDFTTFHGLVKGSSTLTFTLLKVTGGVAAPVANSGFTSTSTVVEKADIKSYELADFSKLLANDAPHDVAVKVSGVLADGSKVVVPSSYYTVRTNDAGTAYTDADTNTIHSDGTVVDATTKEGTVPVIVTVEGATGPQTIVKNLVVSTAPAVANTLSLTDDVMVSDGVATVSYAAIYDAVATKTTKALVDTFVNAAVDVVDQYGIDISANNTFTTQNVLVTNIVNSAGVAHTIDTIAAGDTFNVTAITNNGKIITFKVIVKA